MKVLGFLLFLSLFSGIFLFPDVGKFLQAPGDGNLWAVLVAGSDTWDNYRHQADICHSYQILHNHGIPDERIVVMMKDDLANAPENPTPGIVINHPNGHDVYKGVLHDYTGDAVTPENFMAVLRGDKKAVRGIGSQKVLQSGPNDHVFVYFADHGAPGLIAFPESELEANQLNDTIAYMHKNKMYQKMVLYIEACESGSMFSNILPNNINVYATTAANPQESSYACYFDDERETYLGDVYSVNWMEDSDKEVLTKETLKQQFKIVKSETNTSHVKQYGDMTIGNMHVSEFQGRKPADPIILPKVEKGSVRNRDAYIEVLRRKVAMAKYDEAKVKYQGLLDEKIKNREFMYEKVKAIAAKAISSNIHLGDIMKKRRQLRDFECYNEARTYFQDKCFKLSRNRYGLELMYVIVNLCEHGVPARVQKYAMEIVCNHAPMYGIN